MLAEVIVGVNKYKPKTKESVEVRSIDNRSVRESQVWLGKGGKKIA